MNLRNAAATFGEGTPPYESIRTTIREHVQSMQARGLKTNLTALRQKLDVMDVDSAADDQAAQQALYILLANLTIAPESV